MFQIERGVSGVATKAIETRAPLRVASTFHVAGMVHVPEFVAFMLLELAELLVATLLSAMATHNAIIE